MKTIKLLKRDITLGIIKRWYILMIPIIFAVAQSWQCSELIKDLLSTDTISSQCTVMDYILYSMQGMNVFRFDPHQSFAIPIYWFAFQIGVSYYIAYYAYNDFVDNGRNIYMALKNRTAWWISKVLWCLISVFTYYIVTFVTISVISVSLGAKLTTNVSLDLQTFLFGPDMLCVYMKDIWLILIILPIFTTIALCLVQLLLGFVISPVISFAVMCAEYVLSAYYTSWFFIANYTMWMRSSYVNEEGINPISGMILAIMLIIVSVWSGIIYFNDKDVL